MLTTPEKKPCGHVPSPVALLKQVGIGELEEQQRCPSEHTSTAAVPALHCCSCCVALNIQRKQTAHADNGPCAGAMHVL